MMKKEGFPMDRSTTLTIGKMMCAACSARIEKRLSKMAGIHSAVVNLAIEEAHVEYDDTIVTEEVIITTIEKMGFTAAVKTAPPAELTLSIGKMMCAACSARIEKRLSKMAGIHSAVVNLTTEKARITYDPTTASRDGIISAIEKMGFTAAVATAEQMTTEKQPDTAAKRRLLFSLIFSLPMAINMLLEFFLGHGNVPLLGNPYTQLALATPVQFISGAFFYRDAFAALRTGGANMSVLVVLGTSAAYLFSLYQLAIGSHSVYFETCGILITLILFGKHLEARAKGRTSQAIRALISLRPDEAHVLRDGVERTIPLAEVKLGDTLIIRPGERIPADGIILQGDTSVDESMLTGESIPVDKTIGDRLACGSVNGQGAVTLRTTAVGEGTALSRIIRIVEEAQSVKAPIQRFADRVSYYFVPAVVLAAIITLIAHLAIGTTIEEALIPAVAVLVIACPCSLGLATPTAILVGSGRAAQEGILFRTGEQLELAHRVDTIILDKTGTITHGQMHVTDLISLSADESTLLTLAASIEAYSEHPIGRAIADYGKSQSAPLLAVTDFAAKSGFGVTATVDNRTITLGAPRIATDLGITLPDDVHTLEQMGKTVILVIEGTDLLGLIAIADTIRPEAQEAIARLHAMNITVHMVTGDNQRTAQHIANQVGIDHIIAEALPEDKANTIARLKRDGHIVAMVGDGINDAPALALADIGISIGSGTDVAIEASSVTLATDDLCAISRALTLSRQTMTTIRQNLFWALIYNVIGIPLAALGYLSPIASGTAMALSSVSVVLSSLRLAKRSD